MSDVFLLLISVLFFWLVVVVVAWCVCVCVVYSLNAFPVYISASACAICVFGVRDFGQACMCPFCKTFYQSIIISEEVICFEFLCLLLWLLLNPSC